MKLLNLLIIILILFLLLKNNIEKFDNNKNNIVCDFVTLTFNNKIELELLKLQAISFKYLDFNLINKIIIIYNDEGIGEIDFIKKYYPENVQSKVIIIYRNKIIKKNFVSSWYNQQYIKLHISKFVFAKYYILLDCKNHFIRETSLQDFFSNKKPKLFLGNPGSMIKYYKNSCSYFKIKDPFNYELNKNIKKLMTITPFIFIKDQVINMINYIEKRENKNFYNFFINNKSITEFYLYSSYLIFSGNINKYKLEPMNDITVTIFNNPNLAWNSYKNKKKAITNKNVKIFGLHRKAIEKMNDEYKNNLLFLYSHFFNEKVCLMIKNFLYDGIKRQLNL